MVILVQFRYYLTYMPAFYQQFEPMSRQFTIVIGLTVVGFMAFGLALSFYRNVLFDEQLKKMEHENVLLQDDIQKSREDLDYYRSQRYKDKYAKENLHRLQSGEKILIITDDTNSNKISSTSDNRQSDKAQAMYEAVLRGMPVIEHWRLFLFHEEKLTKLKAGL